MWSCSELNKDRQKVVALFVTFSANNFCRISLPTAAGERLKSRLKSRHEVEESELFIQFFFGPCAKCKHDTHAAYVSFIAYKWDIIPFGVKCMFPQIFQSAWGDNCCPLIITTLTMRCTTLTDSFPFYLITFSKKKNLFDRSVEILRRIRTNLLNPICW